MMQLLALVLAVLPSPAITPGAINPLVTQANIHQTICVHGWTGTVRPPVSVTNKLKIAGLKAYGYADLNLKDYEEDHFVSIEDGGSPDSPLNLWPEPYAGQCGARTKDKIETRLHALVCTGKLTLQQAQHELMMDWTQAYRARIGPLECGK